MTLTVHHLVEVLHLVLHVRNTVLRPFLQVIPTVPHQATNTDPHLNQVTHILLLLEDHLVMNMDHRHNLESNHGHQAPLMVLLVILMDHQMPEDRHFLRVPRMVLHKAEDLWDIHRYHLEIMENLR